MLKTCLLALSLFALLAVGASTAKAEHRYRPYGHHGGRYSSHSMYWRGGYGHSRYGKYPPSISYRRAYPYYYGRDYYRRDYRHAHYPARGRGGVYFSIGF